MTTSELPAADYDAVTRLLAARTGLVFSESRRRDVCGAVQRAARRNGGRDPLDYVTRLEEGTVSLDDLVDEVTIGETYFLRDAAQFDLLRSRVLPELSRARAPEQLLRLWSAGCASGEEAYSLAILLEEEGLAGRSHVLGTDISRAALGKARAARYADWALRGTTESFRHQYFERDGHAHRLAERFRDRVTFEHLNLAAALFPSLATGTWSVDVIFCRNVLLYFDAATVARVAARLHDALAPGGWLVVGASDPPLTDHAPLEQVLTPDGVFYRRGSPASAEQPFVFSVPSTLPPLRSLRPSSACLRPSSGAPDPWVAAQAAFAQGDWARVLDLGERLRDEDEARVLYIRSIANARGTTEALAACTELLGRQPRASELHYLQALLLQQLGRHAEAEEALRRVLYLDPSLATAYFVLGGLQRRRGDVSSAVRAYENALELAEALPSEQPVPLAEGEPARRLAAAAAAELASLRPPGRRG